MQNTLVGSAEVLQQRKFFPVDDIGILRVAASKNLP